MSNISRTPYDSYGEPAPRMVFPRPTPMVRRLLLITALAFVGQYFVGWATDEGWINEYLGLAPRTWGQLFPFLPVWQLVTYGFLHDTHSLMHLLWNLVLLYFFGTMLEGILGAQKFLIVYLSAMLAGAALHLVAEPLFGNGLPAIGASGAVLGVMIACAVLQPNATVILLFVPIPLKWLATGLVALDLFGLLESWRSGLGSFVAHYVHLGGAAYGFLAARRRWIWLDPIQQVQSRRAAAVAEQRVNDEQRMDDLLGKIHREGLGALSRREKEFLKRMSKRR